MVRQLLLIGTMLGIELAVVLHWFVFPRQPALMVLAVVAGGAMCLMALADVLLLLDVLRKRPGDPQQRRELEELAAIEPSWVAMTAAQVVFLGAALAAGVYWLAAALLVGQGAELVAVAVARLRVRQVRTGPVS
jgi:hypothetical protein